MFPHEERRIRRSPHRDLALGFQLEHVRDRGRLEALVLADDDGLSLAAAGDLAVCRELAAVAPLLAKSVLGIPMPPLLRGAEVAVRRAARLGCGIVAADPAAAFLYLSAWREEGHDPANARIALQVEGSLDGDRLRALAADLAAAGRLDLVVPGDADRAALARIAALRSAASWGE